MTQGSAAVDLLVGRDTTCYARMRFLSQEHQYDVTKFHVARCFIAEVTVGPVMLIAARPSGWHDTDTIKVACVSGSARFRQDGITQILTPGSCVFFDTAKPYVLTQRERARQVFVHLPRDMLSRRHLHLLNKAQAFHRASNSFVAIMESLLGTTVKENNKLSEIDLIRLSGTLAKLTGDLLESRLDNAKSGPPSLDALRTRVKTIINGNISDPNLSIEEIARRAGCSARYVYRAFDAEQTTPNEYIRDLRLEHARNRLSILEGTCYLAEIAYKSGFGCYAHFSRAFRAQYGVSPREWRNRLLNKKRAGRSGLA